LKTELKANFTDISHYCSLYGDLFKVYRRSNERSLSEYIEGLFHECKHNIERLTERIPSSSYHQLQHFISDSKWEHKPVLQDAGRDISRLLAQQGGACGLTIDEEGHLKKGKESVGGARQYLGSIGKVDNGQVSVFAALNQGEDVAMVNVKLFLPQHWCEDSKRCEKVGIPLDERLYKTKWELALEMIDEMEGLVNYDGVNADGFYGNAQGFGAGLAGRKKFFVLDIHQDQGVYEQPPSPYVPLS
jgi:SRSO17 transposase